VTRNAFRPHERYSDPTTDSPVGKSSTSDWNAIHRTRTQRSRYNVSNKGTMLFNDFNVVSPLESTRVSESTLLTTKKDDFYALSPSRIRGFIQRSLPHSQEHSTVHDPTADPHDLVFHPRTPDTSHIDLQTPVHASGLDDPLAEFEHWLASGAVEIIPN
jgi:ATP-dependent DNA helicase HFM1/MER3